MRSQPLPPKKSLAPFLKWAGGKRWLIENYSNSIPNFSGRYFEPFLGGGAMFFHLLPNYSVLSDVNEELIECYRQIRDRPEEVVEKLKFHHVRHSNSYYYDIRSKKYVHELDKAARFLYLNRTCYNGLYRVNLRGEFNVPIGTKVKVFDEGEDFVELSRVLQKAELRVCDFEKTIGRAVAGDFVFIDPPYTVKHDNNGFIKYNETIFSWDDQIRLRDAIVLAAARGVAVLATNAAHKSVIGLYKGIGKIKKVKRTSVLAGKGGSRGSVEEMLLSVG